MLNTLGNSETLIFLFACVALIVAIAAARSWQLRRREQKTVQKLESVKKIGYVIPPTLHPIIDPNLCIASGSCTRACPQGNDVVGLVNGCGALINPNHCIGHGECAVECPVGAIRLVFGTSERGVDIPHLTPKFESNVKGIYIAGELGGMGLIANAVRQATQAMNNIRASIGSIAGDLLAEGGLVDVAIIGAGPAGLSAALCATEHKLTYRILEKEPTFGGAILHYPRKKLVLTEPVTLPLLGHQLPRTLVKEDLLKLWQDAVAKFKVEIEHGTTVEDIRRESDGFFRLKTNKGEVLARKVLLCVGRRGMPRKLGVQGEESEKVTYTLRDPEEYAGRHVLVIGAGDSALEAACTLAEETNATVSLSYRGASVSRAKPANVARLNENIQSGRLRAIWSSEAQDIQAEHVVLKVNGALESLRNDDVLIFAGGTLPTEFLTKVGVKMERHHGEELAEPVALQTAEVFGRIEAQRKSMNLQHKHVHDDAGGLRRLLRVLLPVVGVALILGILTIGGEYYFAPEEIRDANESLHPYAPSGIWGQTVGVLALFFMLTNFTYYIRKEYTWLKGWGSIHVWMQIHVFSGLLTGVVAIIHSCLFARNLFAVALYLSLGIVVLTGVIGRYIYGFVPLDPRGRPLAHAALVSLSAKKAEEFGGLFQHLAVTAQVNEILAGKGEAAAESLSLGALIVRLAWVWPARYLQLRRLMRLARTELKDAQRLADFDEYASNMLKMRFQMDYMAPLKRLLGLWRSSHAILAVFLIILIMIHVVIEFWVGYTWIF